MLSFWLPKGFTNRHRQTYHHANALSQTLPRSYVLHTNPCTKSPVLNDPVQRRWCHATAHYMCGVLPGRCRSQPDSLVCSFTIPDSRCPLHHLWRTVHRQCCLCRSFQVCTAWQSHLCLHCDNSEQAAWQSRLRVPSVKPILCLLSFVVRLKIC